MKKKLFAFDVDGTLLDHKNNEIPDSALKTIKHLKSEGHIVGIATGRNQRQLSKALDRNDFDFCILCNGGYLEMNGKKVYDIQFPQKNKVELCDLFDNLNYEYSITTEKNLFSKEPYGPGCQRIIEQYKVLTPEKKTDLRTLPVYQFSIYEENLSEEVLDELNKKYHIHSLGEIGYDVVYDKINKGNMLRETARILNIDLEDTIAFGDADNDIILLKEAGIGVAMGNGTEGAKKSADYVTSESYNDGIYNGVKKLGYIN